MATPSTCPTVADVTTDPEELQACYTAAIAEARKLISMLDPQFNADTSDAFMEEKKRLRHTMQVFLPESLAPHQKKTTQQQWGKKPDVALYKQGLTKAAVDSLSTINWPHVLGYYQNLEREKQAFEFAGLEVRTIPDDDPRVWIRGRKGLFVKHGWHLPPYTVLGPYSSVVAFDAEYIEEMNIPSEIERESTLHDFRSAGSWEVYKTTSSENKKLNDLIGDAFGCSGNILRNINDCRHDPHRQPLGGDKDKLNNVMRVEILDKGWPYVFMATTRAIASGEEVLIDHDDAFWTRFVTVHVKRMEFKDQYQAKIKRSFDQMERGSEACDTAPSPPTRRADSRKRVSNPAS